MKLCSLFVAAFMLAATGGGALGGEVSFGAKAGFAVSNITETPEEWEDDTSFRAGFAGGAFLNYAVTPAFSLQPELLYVSRGVKSTLYDDLVLVELEASFDYVELPVLAKYSFLQGKDFRPCVYAGPCVAFAVGSELEVSALLFSAGVDFSSLTHTTDFAAVAGAGFDYEMGGGTLTFDARFQRGFTNVILTGDFEIDGSTQTISGDDFKNYGFVFMLGYLF